MNAADAIDPGAVFCSICGEQLPQLAPGAAVLECKVFDWDGDLDSILLVHTRCGESDNRAQGRKVWT